MERELTPQQVADLRDAATIELVDVREADEWSAGRLDGARHIVLSELAEQAPTIARDRPVVFVCRSGARSAMATEAFAASGYDAHNLTGGLLAWVAAGLPFEGHVA